MAASAPGSSVLTTSLPGQQPGPLPPEGPGCARIYVREVAVDLTRWLRREQERRRTQRAEREYRERMASRPDDDARLDDGRVHDSTTGQWRLP